MNPEAIATTVGYILGGIVSKLINDGFDITKAAIRKANINRKKGVQNFQTRIYQATIDALNEFTRNNYTDEDLYDVAEKILNGLKSGENDYVKAVNDGLKILPIHVDDSECRRFLSDLYHVISSKEEYNNIYKEIQLKSSFMVLENESKELVALEKIDHKIDSMAVNLENKLMVNNQETSVKSEVYNRVDEYAAIWNKNMFLNNFNKREKGVNVKLSEVYEEEFLPHYVWKQNYADDPLTDIKELLAESIQADNDKQMLLILGQPGIGKSTLITWILAKFPENKHRILVYKFASDLKDIKWNEKYLWDEIEKSLKLEEKDLKEKILILDGFDEISVGNGRDEILNRIYQKVPNSISLIITCRENSIQKLNSVYCNYITLQPWDKTQIISFCKIYEKKIGNCISRNKLKTI